VHLIELAEPDISRREAVFAFTVTPHSRLYRESSFHLRFPDTIDLRDVPAALWWRIALMCLHAHWPLLRPCRIQLPVRLAAGEAELWLRLTDAAVATLEAHRGGSDTARTIELIETGPPAELPHAAEATDRIVSCFSGGRDSITQAAMLCELTRPPLLVSVTSPVAWSVEHETPRRRQVLEAIVARRGLELIEVESDLRASWNNDFSYPHGIAVNEVSDTLLYLAAATAVASARRARLVLMASEAEVQENAKPGGMVIQARHYMYSAVTMRALSAALAPSGIEIGSLTSSLRQFQVQRLLASRYADLRDLQYSCWELREDQGACSRCRECRGIALNLLADGVAPSAAGIDLLELLNSLADWSPGERYLNVPGGSLPRERAGAAHEAQELRCLVKTRREDVAKLLDHSGPSRDRERALAIFDRLRAQAVIRDPGPEPGYRDGYLELVDAELREAVRAILAEHFEPAPVDSYAQILRNTRLLARWISDPIRRPSDARAEPSDELEGIEELVPDPEPELVPGPAGRVIRVADTVLDGNELAYVRECVQSNWISSAGSYVPELEAAFAEAVGCRYAIACSSGTAALHLAVAACGIGAGDEVIIPAFTMIATASAVRYVGAEPVLVDADPETWNLDIERLRDKLSRRTRAIIPVHTYGQPADMDALRKLADDNGLLLIEDAAEAHGATYRGRPVGSLGNVGAFSLYANKILTTGEGGLLSTDDERIATAARELRDHAFSRERHFWHRRLGFNYRMTNLQAAIGLAQLERFGELVERRRHHAQRYREELAGIAGLGLPPALEGGVNWMFGITLEGEFPIGRDELRRDLAARGIETRTFFVPLHLQPVHRLRFRGQRYPVAERLCTSGLYLPSGPGLTQADIDYVAAAIRERAAVAGEDRIERQTPGGSPSSV
jgi:perosamine synthetase